MVTILPVVSPDVLADPAIFQKIVEHGACLISYSHYVKDQTKALNAYQALARAGVRVVLDSGAYEVYTSGGKFQVDIDDYGKFLQKWAAKNARFKLFETYINLDVIHEPKPSKANFMYLRHIYGLYPMPVFHFQKSLAKRDHEYWEKDFEFCLNNPDANGVVGLGGAVRQSRTSLAKWYDEIYRRVNSRPLLKVDGKRIPVKFHALGVASYKLLKTFRYFFYYADASTSTWGDAAYGLIHVLDLDLDRTYEIKIREISDEEKRVRDIVNDQCKQLGLVCDRHKRNNDCMLCEMSYGGCV